MEQSDFKLSADKSSLPGDAAAARLSVAANELLTQPGTINSAGSDLSTASAHLPPMEIFEFQARAEHLLAGAKLDSGNHYQREDLVRLVQDPSIKEQDAVTASTLYQVYADTRGELGPAQVTDMHIPTYHDTDDLGDLKRLKTHSGFSAVDKNHDGLVSARELEASPRFNDLEVRVPAIHNLLAFHPEGLRSADIDSAYKTTLKSFDDSDRLMYYSEKLSDRLNASSDRTLFGDIGKFESGHGMDGLVQGQTGDCYLVATLAKVAQSQPQLIRDAIVDNHNNTYTVTFKGDPSHPMTVNAPTDSELALYTRGGENGIWPAVMEKAYAQYAVEYLHKPLNGGTPQDAIDGGYNEVVSALLTGHSVIDLRTPAVAELNPYLHDTTNIVPADQLMDRLGQALDQGKVITMGAAGGSKVPAGMEDDHSYAVVGMLPGPSHGGILLRDPRGDRNAGASPFVEVKAADIKKYPLVFTLETDEKIH